MLVTPSGRCVLICLAFGEVVRHIEKIIDRRNRRLDLNVSENGEVTTVKAPPIIVKPKIPQMKYSELPDEIKEMFNSKMSLDAGED